MSAATFTPGPWHVLPYSYVLNEPTRARVHGPNNEPVVDDANPSLADARLIAAAPELLAALRAYASWFDHHPTFFDAITGRMREAAHAAIAKAEGSAD